MITVQHMLNILHGRHDLLTALAGRTVSVFGDEVALIALALRLQSDGAHPYEVGLLLAAGVIPLLLLARPVGSLVDAHDSRHLLVAAGLAETGCTIPLIFLHSVVAVVILVACLGATASLGSATWSALIPRVVGEDQVAGAMSATQSLNALALVGAAAVGGLLTGVFGTGVPLALDAATFVAVTVAAGLIRTRRTPDLRAGSETSTEVRGGFGLLRADRILAPLTAGVGLVVLLVGMVDVVLVFLVRQTLHAGGVWYGVIEASWMAGMVGGAVAGGRLRTEQVQVRATIIGAGVACAALAPFALVPAVWILIPLSIAGGIGNGYAGTCYSTLLIARTPDAVQGRVSAAANATVGGAQGASLLLGGAVATLLSPREVYAVAGLLGVGAAITLGFIDRTRAHEPVEMANAI
jgi:MFS family permease